MAKRANKHKPAPIALEERDKIVRLLTRRFSSAIPAAAASSGVYQFPEGGPEYAIADGTYRVDGADWVLLFKGGCLLEAQRAGPQSAGDAIVVSAQH